jgi:nucleoside-diphosphate-sugar epimerase
MHALTSQRIRVFGGSQMRPNIHVQDLVDFYVMLLEVDETLVRGQAFNVSRSNSTVLGLAEMIRDELDRDVSIDVVETDDLRSYHLSAAKAEKCLGFVPVRDLRRAVRELRSAYEEGRIPDHAHARYRNVEYMKQRPEFWGLVL